MFNTPDLLSRDPELVHALCQSGMLLNVNADRARQLESYWLDAPGCQTEGEYVEAVTPELAKAMWLAPERAREYVRAATRFWLEPKR